MAHACVTYFVQSNSLSNLFKSIPRLRVVYTNIYTVGPSTCKWSSRSTSLSAGGKLFRHYMLNSISYYALIRWSSSLTHTHWQRHASVKAGRTRTRTGQDKCARFDDELHGANGQRVKRLKKLAHTHTLPSSVIGLANSSGRAWAPLVASFEVRHSCRPHSAHSFINL